MRGKDISCQAWRFSSLTSRWFDFDLLHKAIIIYVDAVGDLFFPAISIGSMIESSIGANAARTRTLGDGLTRSKSQLDSDSCTFILQLINNVRRKRHVPVNLCSPHHCLTEIEVAGALASENRRASGIYDDHACGRIMRNCMTLEDFVSFGACVTNGRVHHIRLTRRKFHFNFGRFSLPAGSCTTQGSRTCTNEVSRA